jgi:hypothetical protein
MKSDKVDMDLADRQAMTHLVAGNQVFHNGVPVQLLYRVAQSSKDETWRVRPLFVEAPDREDRFISSDRISFLHTMKAPCWATAA